TVWELFSGGTAPATAPTHKERSGEGMPKSELEVSRRRLLAASTATAMIGVVPTAPAKSQTANQKVPQGAVSFEVNGKPCSLQLDNRTTLLDALRERLRLTGTKKGCDQGQCG